MPTGFPYDNVVAGVLLLVVAFGFHFGGQGLSLLNWDLAIRLGLQEKESPPEFIVYEHAIAVADVLLGWIYGLAGIGLILSAPWAFKLAFIPGSVLIYHALSFWWWTGNANRLGVVRSTGRTPFRQIWFGANLGTGLVALFVAWHGA